MNLFAMSQHGHFFFLLFFFLAFGSSLSPSPLVCTRSTAAGTPPATSPLDPAGSPATVVGGRDVAL